MAAVGWTAGLTGCARWSDNVENSRLMLQQAKVPTNTVVMEAAFVQVSDRLRQPIRELWQKTDEQHLSPEQRREIYANGLRTGTVGNEFPSVLKDALDEQKVTAEQVAQDPSKLSNPTTSQHRIQCRSGKIVPIVVSPTVKQRDILVREDGAIRGRTFPACQCIIELEAEPMANGLVAVHLTPMVEYGEAKSRPVGKDGTWQLAIRKDQHQFSHLAMSMEMRAGETVLLSCSEPPQGLGGAFFADSNEPNANCRLVLLRVAQTQRDGLFDALSNPSSRP